MHAGRKRYIERLHAFGMKAPGGRPPRIPDWLRYEVIREAEKELAGLDLDAILAAELPLQEMSESEKLTALQQLETAMLLERLRAHDDKNRNRSAIAHARYAYNTRTVWVSRGDRQPSRLDELIEDVALR